MDAAQIGLITTVVGTIVTLISVLVAWYFSWRAQKGAAVQQQLAERAAQAATEQHRLAAIATAAATEQQRLTSLATAGEWLRDLRMWANEAIDVLSEAAYRAEDADRNTSDQAAALRVCQYRLSALIERGRFFLPNVQATGPQPDRPSAHQGYRHPALNPLVAAHNVVSGRAALDADITRHEMLIALREVFVSYIQQILGPDYHNETIASIIRDANKARQDDVTLGGLLPGTSRLQGSTAFLRDVTQGWRARRTHQPQRPTPDK